MHGANSRAGIGWIVACVSLTFGIALAETRLDVSEVERTIEEWETAAQVRVSADAKRVVTAQITAFAQSNSHIVPSRLARAYLFELRDASRQPNSVSLVDIEARPLLQFLSDHIGSAAGATMSVLGLGTANADSYVKGGTSPPSGVVTYASFDKSVGYVRCYSDEPQASILLNGRSKGKTERELVVSTGSHKIEIRGAKQQCEQTISVAANAEIDVRCPPSK